MLNTLSCVTVCLKLLNFWYLSRREFQKALWSMLAVYAGYAVVETLLYLDNRQNWSMLLFVGLDMAGMAAAARGLWNIDA